MSSHSMNRPAPISVFSDQRRTKSTIWSRVSCGTQSAVRVPQASFYGHMLGHQLSQNLVLGLDFLLKIAEPLLVGGVVPPRFLVESCRPILEELFLSAVEDGGLQTEFIAELRDGFPLQQMPSQDGGVIFRHVMLPLRPMPTLLGERLLH